MSNSTFAVVLAFGAAALALWIQVRFPSLAPTRLIGTMLHAGVAYALLSLASDPDALTFGAIFFGLLPALVYALLCAIWMLRLTQTALGLSR